MERIHFDRQLVHEQTIKRLIEIRAPFRLFIFFFLLLVFEIFLIFNQPANNVLTLTIGFILLVTLLVFFV